MGAGYPLCHKCRVGVLVPLSDIGTQSAPTRVTAWVCTNCPFNVVMRDGDIVYDAPVTDAGDPRGNPGSPPPP